MSLLLTELDKLSLTIDFIAEGQVQQITRLVNERIDILLQPHIVDVVWKQEAEDGIVLCPLSAISFDKTERSGAKMFPIRKGSTEQTGIWAWAYEYCTPVWIDNITKSPYTSNGLYRILDGPILNKATGEEIPQRYLSFFRDTDSILVVPLITKGVVRGVYSIELPMTGRFTDERVSLIEKLAKCIARILWKSEVLAHNHRHTSQAIGLFTDTILKTKDQMGLSPFRTGFVSRPFEKRFNPVEDAIRGFLENKGIKAEHYKFTPGRGFVIDDLMDTIKLSHFGIGDITGNNPNVMLELGMMMILEKKFILFRQKEDVSEVPFNLRNYHLYEYKEEPGIGLIIWNPGSSKYEPIEAMLKFFILELELDPSFKAAREWSSASQT